MRAASEPCRTLLRRTGFGVLGLAGALAVATPAGAQPPDPATDHNGYVGTAAYCQGTAAAVAFGRTEEALVAICRGPEGQLQYRGVRLRDESALMLTATADGSGGFTAANGDVVYTVSSAELVVTEAGTTVVRQPMLQFYAPNSDWSAE
ncbi:hypothetical protein ACN27E_04375 [Mycobacterium sp. WMMD1722]|uniref:hypothetical protein n=1 Tax=Mycobacterium sp. WMMD1722 TaxID=3404117 RepID=UPI003BF56A98